jgi:hypothetical protein
MSTFSPPRLFCSLPGGQKALDLAIKRSVLINRGELIKSIATPTRANMPHRS